MSVVEPPSVPPFPAPSRRRPRVKKLRLLLIAGGLGVLGVVSTIFGMMMAVASDLPALENMPQYRNAQNSTLIDRYGKPLGLLVSNQNRVLVTYEQISPAMRNAIIAIEDRRFYTNSGVDVRGIGRAFFQDVVQQKAAQGGSTITQQFVKVAMEAQGRRTLFEKLREAALAYHLTRKWSKEKILTEYLNAIYFGNGAYGIESAARTYFRNDLRDPQCGTRGHPMCAELLRPAQAALIAGVVASPSRFDPLYRAEAARRRRNVVLKDMLDQGYITASDHTSGRRETVPVPTPPYDDSQAPYFTTWVRQQLVDQFGPRQTFEGGLRVRTTLDLQMQQAAETAVGRYLSSPTGPSSALVAIDNATGEVRAMVGGRANNGRDFADAPFNLATQGQRQPGSAFKPFVLAAALRKGITPGSTWTSKKKVFDVPGTNGHEKFTVNNYEGSYTGIATLANATINSDNSVYADVGYKTGFRTISSLAQEMGIRTSVSTNPAIALGGLQNGVTVLDMAHAYETFAHGGQRVQGTLGSTRGGPVGIREVERPNGKTLARNETELVRVVSRKLTDAAVPILRNVVRFGTGRAAQISGVMVAGKTGTTENYGDAWFVGFTDKWTVAVWVGYADRTKPMLTEFRGKEVAGGTFPALIFRDFVTDSLKIQESRTSKREDRGDKATSTTTLPAATSTTGTATSTTGAGTSTSTTTTTPPAVTTPSTTSTPAAVTGTTPAPVTTPATTTGTSGAGTGGAGVGGPATP